MPELPEVETVRKSLEKLYLNKTIDHVEILLPRMILSDIETFIKLTKNATFTSFGRIGKYLLLNLDNDHTIISHLRMEGKYIKRSKDENINKHTRVVFHLKNGDKMCYDDSRSFGIMKLVETSNVLKEKEIAKLGPEPFSISLDDLYSKLQKDKGEIKAALLNQDIMTGLGNIYVDEVLYKSKINPYRKSSTLSYQEVETVLNYSIETLNHAIELGGSTVSSYHPEKGVDGRFQNELVCYGKANTKCPRCLSLLRKDKLQGRGTTYCPKCQNVSISLGITGKIASGKSTVLKILKEKGFKIFSSDEEVARLYTLESVKKGLINIFGEGVLNDNLTISKPFIKNAIFNDLELKKKLEDYIHPLVKQSIKSFISKNKTEKLIVIEVPLMFEQKIHTLFDYILGIDCSYTTQVVHLSARGSKSIETDLIINQSNKFDKNASKCHYILNNDGSLEELNNEINSILKDILK